ncbi:MAG: diaminopimelate epimerase [Elusimicrobiota bacterium]
MSNAKVLHFWKMQGTGNDFVVFDNRRGKYKNLAKLTVRLCNRKTGIGADGVLVVEKSAILDFKMRIFNSDGSEAEMCGNGARCIVRYAYENSIIGTTTAFETKAGTIEGRVIDSQWVEVKLTDPHGIKLGLEIIAGGRRYTAYFVNTGVPHAVIYTTQLQKVNVNGLGRLVRYHKKFSPAGTNVNFVQIEDGHTISVRTYERGVEAETLACGTGSTAAAIISGVLNKVEPPVTVITSSGEKLKVKYNLDKLGLVYLTGKVQTSFTGEIKI